MNIKIIELLNKKDDTEVYEVSYNNKLSIFKIYFVKENFYLELNCLKVLSKSRLVQQLITYKDNFETNVRLFVELGYKTFFNKDLQLIIQEEITNRS